MNTKKNVKPYTPKKWESLGGNKDLNTAIYDSQQWSNAFRDLSLAARELYRCMKSSRFHKSKKTRKHIAEFYPDEKDNIITFPQAKWLKGSTDQYRYDLFANKKSFYKHRDELIAHGFIETVENNKARYNQNYYRLSDKWKYWKKE